MRQEPDGMGAKARDYLADDFDQQAADSPPEPARGYRDFADYLRALPAAGGRMAELGELLRPFLEDDPRLGGTLYPDGDAVRFMDSLVPDGDPEICDEYLDEFLGHLRADHRRWLAHVAARGIDAEWTLEKGRPGCSCLPGTLREGPDHGAAALRELGALSGGHDPGRAPGDVRHPSQEGQRADML